MIAPYVAEGGSQGMVPRRRRITPTVARCRSIIEQSTCCSDQADTTLICSGKHRCIWLHNVECGFLCSRCEY